MCVRVRVFLLVVILCTGVRVRGRVCVHVCAMLFVLYLFKRFTVTAQALHNIIDILTFSSVFFSGSFIYI